jgi:hypothetical protein
MDNNIKWLEPEEIFEQLNYLGTLSDTSVDSENPHAIAFFIEKLSANFANASYVYGSARYRYDERKSPSSIALKTWAEELVDKLNKRLSALQSVMHVARDEKNNSKFQPF